VGQRSPGDKLSRVVNIFRAKRAQPFTKVKSIRLSVMLGALYKAGGAVWPLYSIQTAHDAPHMVAGLLFSPADDAQQALE
jgi:transposase